MCITMNILINWKCMFLFAESLKAICETFKVALCVKELNVPIFEGKLERRKSKMPLSQAGVRAGVFRSNRNHHHGHNPNHGFHLELPSLSSMPRNISEGQLNSLKTVGSRALSNVTSHFAKLNPITTVKALRKKAANGSTTNAPTILASVDETSATVVSCFLPFFFINFFLERNICDHIIRYILYLLSC